MDENSTCIPSPGDVSRGSKLTEPFNIFNLVKSNKSYFIVGVQFFFMYFSFIMKDVVNTMNLVHCTFSFLV